jgi:hypothetical protein
LDTIRPPVSAFAPVVLAGICRSFLLHLQSDSLKKAGSLSYIGRFKEKKVETFQGKTKNRLSAPVFIWQRFS